VNISPDLKLQFERRARQTKDKHEYARLCVILAKSEGMSIELIAQAHRISTDSVYRYLAEYEVQEKTRHDPKGGSESKLSEPEARELAAHLR
jgi:transposase